jgi:hypothetical protein
MEIYNSTSEAGLVQEVHDICGTNDTTYTPKKITRRLNMALNDFFLLAMKTCGNWSTDSSNATDRATATTDLASARKDYSLPTELLVLEMIRVKDGNGNYNEISPVDKLPDTTSSGTPTEYKKEGNSIILYPTPSNDLTAGLEVTYRRAFGTVTVSGTTFTPTTTGTPTIADGYLCRKTALPFLLDKGKSNKNDIAGIIANDEVSIAEYFNGRARDEKSQITVVNRQYK